jgi:hypothetical protein
VAAAKNGHLTIVQTLIGAGADPRIHAGVTQATAEFYARQNGHVEVSNFLRSVTG